MCCWIIFKTLQHMIFGNAYEICPRISCMRGPRDPPEQVKWPTFVGHTSPLHLCLDVKVIFDSHSTEVSVCNNHYKCPFSSSSVQQWCARCDVSYIANHQCTSPSKSQKPFPGITQIRVEFVPGDIFSQWYHICLSWIDQQCFIHIIILVVSHRIRKEGKVVIKGLTRALSDMTVTVIHWITLSGTPNEMNSNQT